MKTRLGNTPTPLKRMLWHKKSIFHPTFNTHAVCNIALDCSWSVCVCGWGKSLHTCYWNTCALFSTHPRPHTPLPLLPCRRQILPPAITVGIYNTWYPSPWLFPSCSSWYWSCWLFADWIGRWRVREMGGGGVGGRGGGEEDKCYTIMQNVFLTVSVLLIKNCALPVIFYFCWFSRSLLQNHTLLLQQLGTIF